jgi:hypothetical protein
MRPNPALRSVRIDDTTWRDGDARPIMKRSAGPHWALRPEAPTRMEQPFLAEQGIERVAAGPEALARVLEATADEVACRSIESAERTRAGRCRPTRQPGTSRM